MGALDRIPVPPAAVSRVLARFDRPALEGFIAVALDLLDLADGDPDLEEAGDETDGSLAEDEPAARFAEMGNGPGCDVADPGGCEHDDREEEGGGQLPNYGIDQTKGPLPPTMIPDQVAMRKHLNRIRETRCEKITYRGSYTQRTHVEYRLKD